MFDRLAKSLRRCLLAMALFSGGSVMSQPAPTVQLALPAPGTNLVFTTSTQSGNFYTMQTSSNLSNWTSFTPLYGSGANLSWTNAGPAKTNAEFFRAQVNPTNFVTLTNYHNWSDAIFLSNGVVEALIIPDAGRVMQFRFSTSNTGPFWENPLMYGQTSTPNNWITTGAFGGDKSWPSPQTNWGSGNWPPPSGFDGEPYTYGITNGVVTIASPVDPTFGIQVTRTIQLLFNQAVMQINTVFQRVSASTKNPVGIWTITQVSYPTAGLYVPIATNCIFAPTDYLPLTTTNLPANITTYSNMISFGPNTTNESEIGFDASSLAWIGQNWAMRIDGPRVAGVNKTNYPDSGCSSAVYTNPNSVPYCEMEFFAPMTNLPVGQSISFTTTYNLFHITTGNHYFQALAILGLPVP
jgi:hypothetical protein